MLPKQLNMSNVKVLELKDAVIYADPTTHKFGVYDSNNKLIPSSLCRHYKGRELELPKKNISNMPGTVIYVGIIPFHFGHFLTEHLDRAYYRKSDVIYAFANNGFDMKQAEPYFFDVLEVLGIPRNRIAVLSSPVRFERVIVPESVINYSHFNSPVFADMFDNLELDPCIPHYGDKIYLSRSKMGKRKIYGEEKIQEIFRKNGFEIIYPETLPIKHQISIVHRAKILAGLAGTALHLALFMKRGRTVIQIMRNIDTMPQTYVQPLINNLRKLNSIFISGSIEKKPTMHYTVYPQIVGVTENLKQFFDDNGFHYDKKDLDSEVSAWKEYKSAILQYRRMKMKKYLACFIPSKKLRRKIRETN